MKPARVLLVVVLVLAAVMAVGQQPARAAAFSYTTGFQVQNLSPTNDASVTITYYDSSGNGTPVSDTIPKGGSKTYFGNVPVPEGFDGSVVISSDQQVAAVVNILGNGGAAGASYVGTTQGATTLMLPLLMKGNSGYNTWFKVQNAGSADATITVQYSDGTTNSASGVKPNSSARFDQSQENHSAKVFSAIVTSTQPLAAAVIEESSTVMFAYSGFTSGCTNPVLPLINANNAGWVTGVQIQNVGSSDTTVTLSYVPSLAGTATDETQTIPAGQSRTFALAKFANGPKFIGSASVTANSANQPLVAMVNQLRGTSAGEAYGGFDPSQATSSVVLPLIMDRNSGYYTGFSVTNVGSAATSVNCTFTNTSYTASNPSLGPGQSLTVLQNGAVANKYVGSGTCTAGAGGKLVAVVNELGSNSTQDQFLVYEGISVSP